MKKRKQVVRVVLPDPVSRGVRLLLEQFRYMGHVKIHRDTDGMCFDVYPPAKVDEESWCKMNAGRMCSFGLNAVVAPAWGELTSAEKNEVEGRS